jgi:hypothetical protein
MKASERERRDWLIIPIILLIGFLCVILAGQWAVRFSPNWKITANMDSKLDPNSDFLTRRPGGFIEPVDASILTAPAWINIFLTPGASFVTGTPFPTATSTSPTTPTTISPVINTTVNAASPTNTFVYFLSTSTSTPRPNPTNTAGPAALPTTTFTVSTTPTMTSTATETATATATPTSTHSPTPIATDPTPADIGTTPDGIPYNLPAGGTLTLGINLVANGDSNFDLVYYEYPAGSGILLDWVIIEISDGNNWYTIFNWGDNIADTNSNMNFNILSNPQVPPEPDERDIPSGELYNSTGIAIDVDSIVPAGTYSYIRFTAPTGDVDNNMEIDAIEVLP